MSIAEGSGDVVQDLGLPADTAVKWAIISAIKACIGDPLTINDLAQGSMTKPELLETWLRGRVRDVGLGELVYVYDVAAKTVGVPSMAQIVRAGV